MPHTRPDVEYIKVNKKISHLKNLEATLWGFSIVLTRSLSKLCPRLILDKSPSLSGSQLFYLEINMLHEISAHSSSSDVLGFYITVLHGLR